MTTIYHLNCIQIESPFGSAIGHCLLLEDNRRLVLIDAGLGVQENLEPEEKLGKELIASVGFTFGEHLPAIRQIGKLGFNSEQVTDIVCTHLDPDHIGGLVDFPNARVHVSEEEHASFSKGHERYLPYQLAHEPEMMLYGENGAEWKGLRARQIQLDIDADVYFIPLFGHTLGHCGVAISSGHQRVLYVGDAYYLRAEIDNPNHPVDQLATVRAVNDEMRRESLERLRSFTRNHGDTVEYFGYHDPTEFPAD